MTIVTVDLLQVERIFYRLVGEADRVLDQIAETVERLDCASKRRGLGSRHLRRRWRRRAGGEVAAAISSSSAGLEISNPCFENSGRGRSLPRIERHRSTDCSSKRRSSPKLWPAPAGRPFRARPARPSRAACRSRGPRPPPNHRAAKDAARGPAPVRSPTRRSRSGAPRQRRDWHRWS